MLKVSVVDDERTLDALRAEWNGLLDDSASDTVFLTWEWITAWWRCYGAGKSLRVLKIEEDGRLHALIPFYREPFRRYGLPTYVPKVIGPLLCDGVSVVAVSVVLRLPTDSAAVPGPDPAADRLSRA